MHRDYFSFKGDGGHLFWIYFKNFFLSLFTLGLYFPWAIVNTAQYIYSNIEFKERRFAYTGTGIAIFKGFIMAVLIVVGVLRLFSLIASFGNEMHIALAVLLLCLGYIVAIPVIIHKALKYDYANTTYAGIRMGYRGDLEEFIKLFLKGLLLTLISIGIYGSWFVVDMKKYITKNTHLGNVEFEFDGGGMELFFLNLKGMFFTFFSLGIYSFWWIRDSFNFQVENTKASFEGNTYAIRSDVSGGKVFSLLFVNMLIIICTLGLGIAWSNARTFRFVCENCSIENEIDVERIEQTEPTYHDAIGVGSIEAVSN